MKGVSINLKEWNIFEPEQLARIKSECDNSVEYMVTELFAEAEASIEQEGEELYLNLHDGSFDNYLGRIKF